MFYELMKAARRRLYFKRASPRGEGKRGVPRLRTFGTSLILGADSEALVILEPPNNLAPIGKISIAVQSP